MCTYLHETSQTETHALAPIKLCYHSTSTEYVAPAEAASWPSACHARGPQSAMAWLWGPSRQPPLYQEPEKEHPPRADEHSNCGGMRVVEMCAIAKPAVLFQIRCSRSTPCISLCRGARGGKRSHPWPPKSDSKRALKEPQSQARERRNPRRTHARPTLLMTHLPRQSRLNWKPPFLKLWGPAASS